MAQINNAALVKNLSPYFLRRGETVDVLAIDKTVNAGDGLTGGGTLTSDITLNVGEGNGIDVQPDLVTLNLSASGGLDMTGGPLTILLRSNSSLELDGTGLALAGYPNVLLAPTGNIYLDPSGNQVDPVSTYDINLGQISKKYLTLHAAELWVETLVAQNTIATIGGRILVGPTTKFIATYGDQADAGNIILNSSFESYTGSTTDADDWTEVQYPGTSTIYRDNSWPYTGTVSMRGGTASTTSTPSYAYQDHTVTAGESYSLSFFSRGDGTVGGYYGVYDVTNAADIIAMTATGNTTTSYALVATTFVVPEGCASVRISVYAPGAFGYAAFDDVCLMANFAVKHNQANRPDILYSEVNGFIEFFRTDGIAISAVDTTSEWFKVAGNNAAMFPAGGKFTVVASTGNNGEWTVSSVAYDGTDTQVTVTGNILDATVDGYILYTGDQTGSEFYYLGVARDIESSGTTHDWFPGNALFNTGTTYDGFIDLYSLNGVKSGIGPTIAGNVRTGTGYNEWDTFWAIGNLNGLYGTGSSDTYGVGLGQYASGKPNILIDSTNGIQIKHYTTTIGQWDTSGYITVGETGAGRSYVKISGGFGVQFYNNTTLRGEIVPAGSFWFGASSTTERLAFDTTNGLRIFNHANSAVLQAPITGGLNIIGTLNVTGSGIITGGGGAVELDANGIRIVSSTAYSATRSLQFKYSSTLVGELSMWYGAGSYDTLALRTSGLATYGSIGIDADGTSGGLLTLSAGTAAQLALKLDYDPAGTGAQHIWTTNSLQPRYMIIGGTESQFMGGFVLQAGDLHVSTDLTVAGGIAAGSNGNGNPATGAITATSTVTGTTGVIGGYVCTTAAGAPSAGEIKGTNIIATGDVFAQSGLSVGATAVAMGNGQGLFQDQIYINPTTYANNTNQSYGLTIQQYTADNEIITLKSTDVNHGVTTSTETDTYGRFMKVYAANGGLDIGGYSTSYTAVRIFGIGATDTTGKTNSDGAYLRFEAYKANGTGVQAPGANANLMVVRSDGLTRFIIDAEGDVHVDGSTTLQAMDDYDDVKLLTSVRATVMPKGHEIKKRFADWMEYSRPVLEESGIVHYNDGPGQNGVPFISFKGLHMLQIDALRQLYDRMEKYERALLSVGVDPKLLT